ncbi:MAG: Sugar transferase [Cypionkella sp.]|uniref:sugar transferase n=1 Tax=Cypionkella sp. TaxID=2811411 RepID=UPI002604EAD4|nr:sugar transferase [Cypionkella sp.]MDB5658706.1 Sugar transferase [Cypionkella sp.]MDB5664386.1 Sugar transferase [Cypionkella sp.]
MTINYPDFYNIRSVPADAANSFNDQSATPLADVRPSGRGPYRRFFKRAFDIAAIVLAAPAVLPIVAVAAVMVARDGGSPFYTQMRVGKGGKRFRMWKLRSMVRDADERMEEFLAANPDARMEWDSTQKLKADPRITRTGKFLRKSSLDELPQLWNVLVGDMSLVGPRPMMICQQNMYPGRAYYALRPGITGYWQTSGRNRTTFEARAGFDDAYEADVSLLTDVKVLAATVGVVVSANGY